MKLSNLKISSHISNRTARAAATARPNRGRRWQRATTTRLHHLAFPATEKI